MNEIQSDQVLPQLMPVIFVPHGGGPMPLLNDPSHHELAAFIKNLAVDIPQPAAILLISAHWEESTARVSSAAAPKMLYDYSGFPPETYHYSYPAQGNPLLAAEILNLLQAQGIPVQLDPQRGFDHGTFVPLMLMYPAADVPVVQLSLIHSLNPAAHIAMGKAIALLRKRGVLIVGSGMSFHNMQAFFSGNPATKGKSEQFDDWLTETLTSDEIDISTQKTRLEQWQSAPEARFCHPREEHLLPLLVCFGAASIASTKAAKVFTGYLFNTRISGFRWG